MTVFIAVQTAFSAMAVNSDTLSCDAIFAANMQSRSVNSFFEKLEYGRNDWTAYCYLKTYGAEGADDYAASAIEQSQTLMQSEGFVKPTDLQKTSITLSLLGKCSQELINEAVYLNNDFDKQGINAYIWGLIALNCADLPPPDNAVNTTETLISHILSQQLPDGGFSLKGTKADTDITATVIYALAPVSNNTDVAMAVDAAVQALISLQLESGGFASMGIENCESTAQAIIALSSDTKTLPLIDEYGLKNVLLKYQRADGGFAHLPNGEADNIATTQACMALTAYRCMSEKGERLFDIPSLPSTESVISTPESTHTSSEAPPASPYEVTNTAISGKHIKFIIAAALVVIATAMLAVFFIGGKKKKYLIAVSAALFILAAATATLNIKNADEYYADTPSTGNITVTISADCFAALEAQGDKSTTLPSDGIILATDIVSLSDGSTAFDALITAAKKQQVRVDYSGSAYGTYISGIGYLYEFDLGSTSGWLYSVNDEIPNVSAGAYTLSDGDVIKFIYTCSLGDVR